MDFLSGPFQMFPSGLEREATHAKDDYEEKWSEKYLQQAASLQDDKADSDGDDGKEKEAPAMNPMMAMMMNPMMQMMMNPMMMGAMNPMMLGCTFPQLCCRREAARDWPNHIF